MLDVAGKEIAVYDGTNLQQWNVYGLDNIGKIDPSNHRFMYLKDHLGSVRAIIDTTNTVLYAQDYDPWGYPLENRTYDAGVLTNTKYKFTAKERDKESGLNGGDGYDYFGARYYNSRIANWTSIDPLLEKHFDYSPYNYVLRSPIVLFDPTGKQAWAIGLAAAIEYTTYFFGGVSILYASSQIWRQVSPGTFDLYKPTKIIDVIEEGFDIVQQTIHRTLPHPRTEIGAQRSYSEEVKEDESSGEEKPQYPVPEIENGKPKGEDWEPPVNPDANWTKPNSQEYLRPDLKHKPPIPPHWDWRDPSGKMWRIFPGNKIVPKGN